MRTVLVTAYDVNPFKGSESGMGWNFIAQLSRFYRVVAITRENNAEPIERHLREQGRALPNVSFLYFDLPRYARFWKRGVRGSSLYFYLWQLTVPLFVRRQRLQFDVVHNLNFHADWAPSLLWTLGAPLLWGPIAHHPKIPAAFLAPYRRSECIKDRARWVLKKWFWRVDPLVQLTRHKAKLVLCGNSDVARRLRLAPEKVALFPSVGAADPGVPSRRAKSFQVLCVGRFVALKGFDVAIAAFERFYGSLGSAERDGVRLLIVGTGPEEKTLRALAARFSTQDAVRFVPWMERASLLQLYADTAVFLFPSHEGAGMVVAEALSFGVPVVCFDNIGPGELVDEHSAIRIPYGDYGDAVEGFAAALSRLHKDAQLRERLAAGARRRFETWLDWDRKGELLREHVERVAT
jgi:glycosyltransferase involved in cell wall biosynthesis